MTSPTSLESGLPYHIFTRGINRENIFLDEWNYFRFMELFCFHVAPIAETYAYCLLRNHFHLFLRIRTDAEIRQALTHEGIQDAPSYPAPGQCIGNLLNAYAKTINFNYHRTGSLFQHPFGRVPVTTDRYYEQLIKYIHQNPQHHGFVKDFREWPFSSYHSLSSSDNGQLDGSIDLSPIPRESRTPRRRSRRIDHSRYRQLIANDYF
ncbi:MAG: hypothetical protein JW929_12815 [Anaerolineales bacterium]|nr:hypothetical protein [Anaerolineales bacterium]